MRLPSSPNTSPLLLRALEIMRETGTKPAVEGLRLAAAPLTCYTVGHLGRPRPTRKWKGRAWRCERCELWMVVVREAGMDGYYWAWMVVDAPPCDDGEGAPTPK